MLLFFSQSHCWDRVTQAVWRKYPNDLNPNVKTMDVLERHVDEQGQLHTTRLVGTEGFLPSWVCNMIGVDNLCYAYEHSVVDPVKKTMTMTSRNVTLSGWADVDETVTYTQDQEVNKWVKEECFFLPWSNLYNILLGSFEEFQFPFSIYHHHSYHWGSSKRISLFSRKSY